MTAEFSTVLQIAAIVRCRNAEHALDTEYTHGYASVVTVSISSRFILGKCLCSDTHEDVHASLVRCREPLNRGAFNRFVAF